MQTHHTLKPKVKNAPVKAFEYELSNANYMGSTDIWLERNGRKYIYVLFTANLGRKVGSVPFYVGQTANLQKRFNGHNEISWHFGKFGNKTIVHVIASVPEELATAAEQKTIQTLVNKGFVVNNKSLNGSTRNIKLMTIPTFKHYCANMKKDELPSLFKNLQKQWAKEESASKAESQATDKGLTKAKIVKLVRTRTYANNQSKYLSQKLAYNYDPLKDESQHIFPFASSLTEEETIKLIQTQIRGLKGDWFMVSPIILLGEPTFFKPAESLVKASPPTITYGRRPANKITEPDTPEGDTLPPLQKAKRHGKKSTEPPKDQLPIKVSQGSIEDKKFLETVTVEEMVAVTKELLQSLSHGEDKNIITNIADRWYPERFFSSYHPKKGMKFNRLKALWRYEIKPDCSPFKHFYPQRTLINAIKDSRENKSQELPQ